jgi:hypothetical protein
MSRVLEEIRQNEFGNARKRLLDLEKQFMDLPEILVSRTLYNRACVESAFAEEFPKGDEKHALALEEATRGYRVSFVASPRSAKIHATFDGTDPKLGPVINSADIEAPAGATRLRAVAEVDGQFGEEESALAARHWWRGVTIISLSVVVDSVLPLRAPTKPRSEPEHRALDTSSSQATSRFDDAKTS